MAHCVLYLDGRAENPVKRIHSGTIGVPRHFPLDVVVLPRSDMP
jgi:hypothetical protein